METTRTLSRVARRARAVLVLSSVLSGTVVAQQQFTAVKGKVTWDSTKGNPNIRKARVQIMDPASPKAGRVSKSTTADDAAEYEIENVAEGRYEIVACDDLLTYRPQRQTVEVRRNGPNVNFKLTRNDPAHPLLLSVGKSMVVYLKHIETGCEFDAKPANGDGIVSIFNTVDEQTLYSKYALCIDDAEEADSRSPFESCVRKELPLGLTTNQVVAKLGKPESTIGRGREQTYVYKHVKVMLVDGKVSGVKVEIDPTA